MNNQLFRRAVSFAAALALAASLGVTALAAEEDGLCEHHPSHTVDCGYEASGDCTHECTVDSGCVTVTCSHEHMAACYNGAGKLNCHHTCDKTPACQIPTVDCVHTEHGSCGHSEGKDCNYAINGCIQCNAVQLKDTDVVLNDGTEYTYTGSLITPAVTVTVDGIQLVENKDYIVTYANNVSVGTGTVIITGTETTGYAGEITIDFTIVEAQAPETPSEPEEEEEETTPFEYKITQGSGSKWAQESGKDLSFTLNADTDGITAIRIDGKKLDSTHYTLGKDGAVTLKSSYLSKLAIGTYRIGMEFADGDVSGTFTVTAAADSTNPSTGDGIGLWVSLMVLSILGTAGLMFAGCRRTRR